MANHHHPGQKEPRSYGRTHHEDLDINLNTASEQELAELPMIGPERARDLIRGRPFESWSELEQLPGFSKGLIDDLKSGGAHL
jgi:DNA uptake protein ComE-like DNA-binding protein